MEVLKNPTDQFPSDIDHVGRPAQAVGSLAKRDAASVARKQTANNVEQGRFPRAGRTHERDHLALLNVHVHAFEDLEFVGAGTERFGEAFD